MFLPQSPEKDCYDAKGRQTDDINSVVEYVRVVLGYDKTPDDEDDDNGNNFLIAKTCDFTFTQQIFQLIQEQSRFFILLKKTTFPSFQTRFPSDAFIEVATPPPNFVA